MQLNLASWQIMLRFDGFCFVMFYAQVDFIFRHEIIPRMGALSSLPRR